MSNVIRLDPGQRWREQIRDQACLYLARLDAGASESDQEEIRCWLEQNELHRDVFLEMAAMWDEISVLDSLSEMFPLDTLQAKPADDPPLAGRKCLAACLAFVMLGFLGWQLLVPGEDLPTIATPQGITLQVHSTEAGEQQTIKLDDGTSIVLNTESRLVVNSNAGGSNVFLEEGEAYFDLTEASADPLRVFAGRQMIEAQGQLSLMRHDTDSLEVLVRQGQARRFYLPEPVDPLMSADNVGDILQQTYTEYLIEPGMQVTLLPSLPVDSPASWLEPDQINAELAWTSGMIPFRNQSVEDVFAALERYTGLRVDAVDTVRDIPIEGYYQVGDTESLLTLLQLQYNIQSMQVGENHLLLYGGPSVSPQ